jgi:hypothetical protein
LLAYTLLQNLVEAASNEVIRVGSSGKLIHTRCFAILNEASIPYEGSTITFADSRIVALIVAVNSLFDNHAAFATSSVNFRAAHIFTLSNMKLIRLTSVLLVLTTFVNAQTIRSANQKTPKNESGSELQQRRATALSILQSLAIEARSYSDEPLRARVQAQIADVLWSHDKEAARSLFRRAT